MSNRKRTPRLIRDHERMVDLTAVPFGYFTGVTFPHESTVTPEMIETSGRMEQALREHVLQEQLDVPADPSTG